MSERTAIVEDLFHAWRSGGVDAVMRIAPADVIWEPLDAPGPMDASEARAWHRAQRIESAAYRFEEIGSAVLATGRRRRWDGAGLSDALVAWVYWFEATRLVRATGYGSEAEARAAIQHAATSELPESSAPVAGN